MPFCVCESERNSKYSLIIEVFRREIRFLSWFDIKGNWDTRGNFKILIFVSGEILSISSIFFSVRDRYKPAVHRYRSEKFMAQVKKAMEGVKGCKGH